jgi:hypothetical protein
VLVDDDLAETLDEGNTTAATVFVPDTVTITLNGSPVGFDIPDSPDLDNITVLDCTAAVSSTAMPATDPEVDDADLGDCDAGDNGLVVYFVTLQ